MPEEGRRSPVISAGSFAPGLITRASLPLTRIQTPHQQVCKCTCWPGGLVVGRSTEKYAMLSDTKIYDVGYLRGWELDLTLFIWHAWRSPLSYLSRAPLRHARHVFSNIGQLLLGGNPSIKAERDMQIGTRGPNGSRSYNAPRKSRPRSWGLDFRGAL